MAGNFLLDRLKEKFGTEDEEGDGFNNLNYKVGNTSGMDVTQQIPSDLAERVGYAAQRGGGEMEIQIANPTSFYLNREGLYGVIEGLGLDTSIHSDPNVGYTALGKQQFDQTHDYFKKYLESFTSFSEEKEKRNLDFRLGRINPHVSVSPVPPVEQGRPQGVALDPFAYSLTEVQREKIRQRRKEGKNIYDNEEFLRRFYRLFVLDEVGDNEHIQFDQQLSYSNYSKKVDRIWRAAKNQILERIWKRQTGSNYDDAIDDKAAVIAGASNSDPSVSNKWIKEIDENVEMDGSISTDGLTIITQEDEEELPARQISNLRELDKFLKPLRRQRGLTDLRLLPEIIYYLKDTKDGLKNFPSNGELDTSGYDGDFEGELWDLIKGPLEEAMDNIWTKGIDMKDVFEDYDSGEEPKVSLIPVQSKLRIVQRQLEIPQDKIWEKAYSEYKDRLRDEVENMFAGEEGYFENGDDRSEQERHENFLRNVINSRLIERSMQTESNAFYRIFPAWMSCCNETYEAEVMDENGVKEEVDSHDGWEAPKFLWKTLVEERHSDKDWNISSEDLKEPRQDNGYFEALKKDQEFRLDVAAAAAGVVLWTHFTQMKDKFELDGKIVNGEEVVPEDYGRYTWIEWMNRYGVGINMEDMAGQPQQMFKLWRPFHIVAACRAVNITARNQIKEEGELGGKDELDEDLDECPVKFTIDMEHVASFGVEPWREMKILAEWEKEVVEDPPVVDSLPGDSDRPLAKMVRMYHLTKPGHETKQGVGHTHGPFRKGDKELYRWLHDMVDRGFAQGSERASVMYELGGEMSGTVQQAKLSMDLIELGVSPEELDPSNVDPGEDYSSEKEALIARFFGMDNSKYSREWAKIEEHAFDPLNDLMEAEPFENTFSGGKAVQDRKLQEWSTEEYK